MKSSMFIETMRFSMFDFTRRSKPAYEWMTYHLPILLRSSARNSSYGSAAASRLRLRRPRAAASASSVVVDLEGLVDGAVGFGVDGFGHGVEHGVEVDLGAVFGDDVQRLVLGGVDASSSLRGQNVTGLRLIVFGGLLGCGRPVHVVAICLRH